MSFQSRPSRAQLFLAAVGEQVLTYRETAGLSLDDVAAKTGIPAALIDQIEHGWFDPRLTDLQALAEAVGATVGELMDIGGTELGLAL